MAHGLLVDDREQMGNDVQFPGGLVRKNSG